jgi:hypothetical protein
MLLSCLVRLVWWRVGVRIFMLWAQTASLPSSAPAAARADISINVFLLQARALADF